MAIDGKPDKRLLNLKPTGRPKGCQNKTTRTLKETIEKTFKDLGGAKGLTEWAEKNEKNKSSFYTLIWPKLIPKNIDLNANITHDIAARLIEARNRAKQVQSSPQVIEIDDKGNIKEITEGIVKRSVIEEIEEEEREE